MWLIRLIIWFLLPFLGLFHAWFLPFPTLSVDCAASNSSHPLPAQGDVGVLVFGGFLSIVSWLTSVLATASVQQMHVNTIDLLDSRETKHLCIERFPENHRIFNIYTRQITGGWAFAKNTRSFGKLKPFKARVVTKMLTPTNTENQPWTKPWYREKLH